MDVYGAILKFSLGSLDGFGYVLAIATPLIFSALAVAVCFKGGMFNIGVEGQYFVGMVTAAWAATTLTFLPGPLLRGGDPHRGHARRADLGGRARAS